MNADHVDIAIIGAGAAGLATAIFVGRNAPKLRVAAFDGARKLGAKILVSGGGRCNVTNKVVRPDDYNGSSRKSIGRVLDQFTAADTVAFFEEIGVRLKIEETQKLFPVTNSARTVLDALLVEVRRCGVTLCAGQRVIDVQRPTSPDDGYRIRVQSGAAGSGAAEPPGAAREVCARRIVLCTGGQSLPKSGSDGFGYELARGLGHTIVPTTPALAPLVLEGDFHASLAGLTHTPALTSRAAGEKPWRRWDSLLWTHFGISGPLVMDYSRHWLRARLEARAVTATLNFLEDEPPFEAADALLRRAAEDQPRTQVHNALARYVPARLGAALAARCGVGADTALAHLARDDRRKLAHALVEFPLPIRDCRGYNYAEATAGGVPLAQVDTATMESRVCPGLYLVGEVLDVDGRIGGFNFQWAWSGAFVAGRALAAGLG